MDDSLPECTESFICVILRPSGESCIAIRDPDTITVVIEDDDGEYSSFAQYPCSSNRDCWNWTVNNHIIIENSNCAYLIHFRNNTIPFSTHGSRLSVVCNYLCIDINCLIC